MLSDDQDVAPPTPDERRPSETAASAIPTGRWVVDPGRSTVSFVAKHLLVSKVTGTFSRVAGTILVSEETANSSVHAVADAASLTTGDEARDEHLRSVDFLDVERWPTLTVTGSGLSSRDGRHSLEALLTIRDVTHPVTFNVTATNLAAGGAPGRRTARFTADAVVNRKDFGLRWNSAIETGAVVVGDMVTLMIVAVADLAD